MKPSRKSSVLLSLDSNNSDAHALQAIIALVHNDKDQALRLARKAIELNPASPAAHIALSYAQQARFQIDEASASVRKAIELDSNSALAWARLAELEMSAGDLDAALAAAQRATALEPGLARTQSVLGFAYLARIDTAAARQAFDKAIELDQADPLSRLGLGLAKIREGELSAGREQIEIAVCLDPGNSLTRSYVGKAYYEEKRDRLAAAQFDAARNLDPRDPTPWLYDAILKQSENRPTEALADLQKSIELNDNRAVYRSRLLLDEDLAARSASQARIYADLGFDQLALRQAFGSLATDPANFSAHRLLADAYLTQPRHEVARVSELLQSQLLQPANLSPLQPQFAEREVFLMEQSGLTNPSFGEYSQLFLRDGLALRASAVAGTNRTLADDLMLSGIRGGFSFSLAQSHVETDGVRSNDDLTQDAYGVFLQQSLTPRTGVQAEYRLVKSNQGDRALRFDPTDFAPNLREARESEFVRIGFRHGFSPGSDLIGSLSYRDFRFTSADRPGSSLTGLPGSTLSSLDQDNRERGYLAEVQHLWRAGQSSLITGGGYYRADTADSAVAVVQVPVELPAIPGLPPLPPLPPLTITTRNESSGDILHGNLYAYQRLNAADRVQITFGLSADAFSQNQQGQPDVERVQLNPKLGLSWTASPSTTVRLAAFRALKRALTSNQTLEPTQVAGFTQFFDDVNGTESRTVGAAIDQSILPNLYAGLSVTRRSLQVPLVGTESVPWTERAGGAYVYWLPAAGWAASARLDQWDFDRGDDQRFNDFEKLRTLKVPLGLAYFSPAMLSARVTTTYVNQSGTFIAGSAGAQPSSAKDSFWSTDVHLDYLLPKRLGFVGVSVLNAFDRSFRLHQDVDPTKPSQREFEPERRVFIRLNLAL